MTTEVVEDNTEDQRGIREMKEVGRKSLTGSHHVLFILLIIVCTTFYAIFLFLKVFPYHYIVDLMM